MNRNFKFFLLFLAGIIVGFVISSFFKNQFTYHNLSEGKELCIKFLSFFVWRNMLLRMV